MKKGLYRINTEKNGIEVLFACKPDEEIRGALKSAGFAWHKAKKIWYAKFQDERIKAVEGIAEKVDTFDLEGSAGTAGTQKKAPFTKEALAAIREQYDFTVTEENTRYEGWKGANEKRGLSDQDLKKEILAELKKHGIKATIRTGRGGWTTSFTFTVFVPEECRISKEDYIYDNLHRINSHVWYLDENGKYIHVDKLYDMDQADRDKIMQRTLSNEYDTAVKEGYSAFVSDDFIKTVETIVDSFNHDNSDVYTDYFDKGFYSFYSWKAA